MSRKKVHIFFLFLSLFSNVFVVFGNEGENYQCFLVSGYYSPLIGQKYYYRGTYEEEIKLNGKGIKGASGKAVFSGMLAAPKKYPFGTKIYLEGFGVGEVADRGSAIVASEESGALYDRIDIWTGYGEEGLSRALAIGKRVVCGQVFGNNEDIPITINVEEFSKVDLFSFFKRNPHLKIFFTNVYPWSEKEDIVLLNTYLYNLGIYTGNTYDVYSEDTMLAIYRLQKRYGIVEHTKDQNAGIWEKNIREHLYALWKKESQLAKKNDKKQEKKEEFFITKNITPFSSSGDIIALQTVLREIGVYTGSVTGVYEDVRDAIVFYQLQNGIISSFEDKAAGYVGPRTRQRLYEDLMMIREDLRMAMKSYDSLLSVKDSLSKKVETFVYSLGFPKIGERGGNVKKIQTILGFLGFFHTKATGYYGPKTKEALINYQLSRGIISSPSHFSAGTYCKKTQEFLIKDLQNMLLLRLAERYSQKIVAIGYIE